MYYTFKLILDLLLGTLVCCVSREVNVKCILWLSQYSRFKKFEQLEKVKEGLLSERLQNADAVKRMKADKVVFVVMLLYLACRKRSQ